MVNRRRSIPEARSVRSSNGSSMDQRNGSVVSQTGITREFSQEINVRNGCPLDFQGCVSRPLEGSIGTEGRAPSRPHSTDVWHSVPICSRAYWSFAPTFHVSSYFNVTWNGRVAVLQQFPRCKQLNSLALFHSLLDQILCSGQDQNKLRMIVSQSFTFEADINFQGVHSVLRVGLSHAGFAELHCASSWSDSVVSANTEAEIAVNWQSRLITFRCYVSQRHSIHRIPKERYRLLQRALSSLM